QPVERLLPVDQELLSECRGSGEGACEGRRSRRSDHDPWVAEQSAPRGEELLRLGLDGRLHRRLELGHDRHLADDPGVDADRDQAVTFLAAVRAANLSLKGRRGRWTQRYRPRANCRFFRSRRAASFATPAAPGYTSFGGSARWRC